ncbi:DUF2256 domain-containing protein [Rubellimicrobium arenae]|uniref:DUF2256 domain-containing protein n=2 Tax=Rubellimicrobium arenae TaxID=2817372 RepID=UPI003F6125B7
MPRAAPRAKKSRRTNKAIVRDDPEGAAPCRPFPHGDMMPKMRRKSDLPSKVCPVCGRPFTWRKAWEKVWEEVVYCSDRCRSRRSKVTRPS